MQRDPYHIYSTTAAQWNEILTHSVGHFWHQCTNNVCYDWVHKCGIEMPMVEEGKLGSWGSPLLKKL